jgi:hypothetical protein
MNMLLLPHCSYSMIVILNEENEMEREREIEKKQRGYKHKKISLFFCYTVKRRRDRILIVIYLYFLLENKKIKSFLCVYLLVIQKKWHDDTKDKYRRISPSLSYFIYIFSVLIPPETCCRSKLIKAYVFTHKVDKSL